MENQSQTPQASTTRSMGPFWIVLILVLVLGMIAALYYFFFRTPEDEAVQANANATVNTNTLSNSAAVNIQPTPHEPQNTNTTVDDDSTPANETGAQTDTVYRNAQFGYTLSYGPQVAAIATATSSAASGALYDEWQLRTSEEGNIIVVQVLNSSSKDEAFASRNYTQSDDLVRIGDEKRLSASTLNVNGSPQGYTFTRGSYTFVLMSDFEAGTQEYEYFLDIVGSFSF